MFRELCGDTTLENVVLVTNMWGAVSREVGKAREKELSGDFFKPAIKAGAQIIRHHDTTKSAHNIVRKIMKNRLVVLQIQRELVDEHKNIVDTAAGEAVNRELNEQIRRHQTELKELQEEMQALKEKDEETRRELEGQASKAREQMEKIKKDSEGMALGYAAEKMRMEAKMREMEQEREQADAERARLERTVQGLIGTSGTLPTDGPAYYDTSPRTRGTGWVSRPQHQVLQTSLQPPGPQVHPRSTPYVQDLFAWPLTIADTHKL